MTKKIKIFCSSSLFLIFSTLLNCATGPNGVGTSVVKIDVSITLKDRGGIIITPDPGGLVNQDITLDHGVFMTTATTGSLAENKLYIKNTLGSFPAGMNILIQLDSDITNSNNLKNSNASIPHALQLNPLENIQVNPLGEGTLTVSGDKITDSKEYKITANGNAVLGIKSTVAPGNIKDKSIGIYTNQSKITISFTK